MPGFASSQPAAATRRIWFSLYSRDNEHDPLAINRVALQLQPGQSIYRLAVLQGRAILQAHPDVWEVIAHRGPSEIPSRGDDVLARICREPFRQSTRLN